MPSASNGISFASVLSESMQQQYNTIQYNSCIDSSTIDCTSSSAGNEVDDTPCQNCVALEQLLDAEKTLRFNSKISFS